MRGARAEEVGRHTCIRRASQESFQARVVSTHRSHAALRRPAGLFRCLIWMPGIPPLAIKEDARGEGDARDALGGGIVEATPQSRRARVDGVHPERRGGLSVTASSSNATCIGMQRSSPQRLPRHPFDDINGPRRDSTTRLLLLVQLDLIRMEGRQTRLGAV